MFGKHSWCNKYQKRITSICRTRMQRIKSAPCLRRINFVGLNHLCGGHIGNCKPGVCCVASNSIRDGAQCSKSACKIGLMTVFFLDPIRQTPITFWRHSQNILRPCCVLFFDLPEVPLFSHNHGGAPVVRYNTN